MSRLNEEYPDLSDILYGDSDDGLCLTCIANLFVERLQ